ncbi:hypothetical protein BSKO_06757 [Bryopsis sp. KO-2023]|nr:hypothetical protein BSKO_06757 [Bryopsis sp. KO-2023]
MSWKSTLSKNLNELRIHLCQTSEGSKGVREFLFGNYVELKKANPKFPFLVREASQVEAKLIARYDFGTEASVSIEGKDSASILKDLEKLVKEGESMPRSA